MYFLRLQRPIRRGLPPSVPGHWTWCALCTTCASKRSNLGPRPMQALTRSGLWRSGRIWQNAVQVCMLDLKGARGASALKKGRSNFSSFEVSCAGRCKMRQSQAAKQEHFALWMRSGGPLPNRKHVKLCAVLFACTSACANTSPLWDWPHVRKMPCCFLLPTNATV